MAGQHGRPLVVGRSAWRLPSPSPIRTRMVVTGVAQSPSLVGPRCPHPRRAIDESKWGGKEADNTLITQRKTERKMNVDENAIRNRCPDAVFERGQTYRREGRIQWIERFYDVVTAAVQGSNQYDVTVELGGKRLSARCTCPYEGPGDCKHVVAVLLTVAADPPNDESERITAVLEDVPPDDLCAFVRDVVAKNPELRDQFLARFGKQSKSVDEYRDEIEALFDQHTQDYPAVTGAIDFSHFFDLAEEYRDREQYLAAATLYRAVFEGIDENENRIDAAYDHYASTLQTALDGYVECVLAADPDPEMFDTYAGVLEERASSDLLVYAEQFWRALDDLEDRR